MQDSNNLIFIDLETTGLKPVSVHRILEIGIVPVDRNLERLDSGWSALINPGDYDFNNLNDVVKEMHTENGLLEDLRVRELTSLHEASKQAIDYCEKYGIRGQIPVAGSTVWFDRGFMEAYMPSLNNWFHYRIVDVSSMKETWKRWYPDSGEPPKQNAHRALEDCYASIEELKWYRDRLQLRPDVSSM